MGTPGNLVSNKGIRLNGEGDGMAVYPLRSRTVDRKVVGVLASVAALHAVLRL